MGRLFALVQRNSGSLSDEEVVMSAFSQKSCLGDEKDSQRTTSSSDVVPSFQL